MLATLATVLALAGAPASTIVVCNPALNESVVLGVTVATTYGGRLDHVELGVTACGALLYTNASPAERAAIRRLNPGINFDQLVGVGLQVALHESEHVALDSTDECLVEKTARSKIDGLISQLGDPARVTQEEAAATASDAALPSQYHGC